MTSAAIEPAIKFGMNPWTESAAPPDVRNLARRLCQAMVLLPLFSLILLPEYVQGLGDPETKSILYRATRGPLRMVDALLLGIIAAHAIVWVSSRAMRLHFPRALGLPGMGFLAAIVLAMIHGALHGGTNLFFDWRALALGIGMYGVFAMWVRTPAEARSAMYLFAGTMALRIGMIYASFLRGEGDVIVGVRIPVFDGPTLSATVFTALLALWLGGCAHDRWQKLLWIALSAACYLLVLLCFRRTFWAELGVATGILLLLRKQYRKRTLLLATLAVAAVALALGPAFYQRLQSMDFTTGESEFSQGNPDHVGEVLDAWAEVRRQPVLGIGLGRSFPTLRIQEWKEESVMVHNAPLHVWLKYGLAGLGCYVWFHFATFRWLHRRHRAAGQARTMQVPREDDSGAKALFPYLARYGTAEAVPFHPDNHGARRIHDQDGRYEDQVWPGVALVYLAAQFVVSLGFTPWPYSSVQSTTLIAFVLAVAVTGTSQCKFQSYPSSPLR